MIFQTKDAIDKIIKGEKTQTRRLIKPNQRFAGALAHAIPEIYTFDTVAGTNLYRSVYKVGRDYAVQPGRGKATVWYMTPAMYEGKRGDPIAYAHTTCDMDDPTTTLWQKAKTTVFHSTGKTNPRAYLQNAGFHELRIRILNIWKEDVRQISDEDAKAEGYLHRLDFLKAWIQMHDKRAWRIWKHRFSIWIDSDAIPEYAYQLSTMLNICHRKERYQAWAIQFEVSSNS